MDLSSSVALSLRLCLSLSDVFAHVPVFGSRVSCPGLRFWLQTCPCDRYMIIFFIFFFDVGFGKDAIAARARLTTNSHRVLVMRISAHRLLIALLLPCCVAGFSSAGLPITTTTHPAAAGPLASSSRRGGQVCATVTEEDSRLAAYVRRQAAQEARGSREARALLDACDGLERGLAASREAASNVEACVAAFEAVSPCKLEGDILLNTLSGRWELVYSSALVRPRGGRRSLRNDLVDASTPQLGAYFQTFRGRQLEEEVTVSLPAPFPLPRLEVCLVSKNVVEGVRFWPGKYAAGNQEVEVYGPGGPERRVRLPSPRRVLDQLFSGAAQILPLELTLLKELEPRGGIGARREFTCTAGLFRSDPRVRVLRSVRPGDGGYGEMRIFAWRGDSGGGGGRGSGMGGTAAGGGSGLAGLPPGGIIVDDDQGDWSSSEPVGQVDANGNPVEEFWTPDKGLGREWGV